LKGGNKIEIGTQDLPHYLLPALCIAYAAMCRNKRLSQIISEQLSDFYKRCSQAVEAGSGEELVGFLELQSAEPPGQSWKRSSRIRDYTEKELEYIALAWESALEEFNSIPSRVASPIQSTEKDAGPGSGEEVLGKEAGGRKDTLRSRDPKSAPAANASPTKNPTNPATSDRGRVKAVARVKTAPRTTKIGARISPSAETPAVPRRVGRKRSFNAASVPISAKSNRALLGQNELNQRFPKSYISASAPKKSPVPNLTLGRAWHVVSALKHALFCIVLRQIVVIRSNELITTITSNYSFIHI